MERRALLFMPLLPGIGQTVNGARLWIHFGGLQFQPGENAASLGLSGREVFDVEGVSDRIEPRQTLSVIATSPEGARRNFEVVARLDSAIDVNYYRQGGILQMVLRGLLGAKSVASG